MSDHIQLANKNPDNKKITLIRSFDSPLEKVWRAWTERELLDLWWAPDPYSTKTISLDFTEGGNWLYTLQCQNFPEIYATMNFKLIRKWERFEAINFICDERGNKDPEFPAFLWKNTFISLGQETKVVVEVYFEQEKDLELIVKMGFESGLSSALNNLGKLLINTSATF